ncbi:MAG: geranylgeranyl reductase family protein [Candidatus Heimdallarchaeota archaeon]
MDAQLIVVGAGPAGSLAAEQAAKNGCKVLVLEQRATIGSPDHCAGLISVSGLNKLGITKLPDEVIQNKNVVGAKFFSPSGKNFTIKRKSSQAYVIDRELFDQHLAEKARKAGAEIFTNMKVKKITTKPSLSFACKERATKKNHQVNATLGILAEGRSGLLAQSVGFRAVKRKHRYSGYQLLVENVKDLDVNFVEIYASNEFAPGFFTWIIPINETTAKVGLASSEQQVVSRMKNFMNKHPPVKDRFVNAKVTKSYAGQVIVGGLVRKTVKDNLITVGDTAGQTKATTGGGVIIGGIAGSLAGKYAAKIVDDQGNMKPLLKQYDKDWRSLLEKQLRSMKRFRKLVDLLKDKAFDMAFDTVIENDLVSLIEQKADIDSQAEVLRAILKHPAVWKLFFKAIPHLQLI